MSARHDRDDLRAAIFGELKRCRADRAGRAVDQDPVAGLQGEMLDDRMGVKGAFADDGLIEAEIRGHLRDRPGFGHAQILRLGAVIPERAHPENAVPGLEQAGRRANGFDGTGEIQAEDVSPRPPGAGQQPHDCRMKELAAIGPVDRRGMDPDQHLLRSGHPRGDIAHLDHAGRPITRDYGRLHRPPIHSRSGWPCPMGGIASPNEKEISHGRVSWQARSSCIAMGPLVTVLVSSIT